MPTRGELISAGFAGLAGILDSSSEEEDPGAHVGPSPQRTLPSHVATKPAEGDKTLDEGGGEAPSRPREDTDDHAKQSQDTNRSGQVDDILADFSSFGYTPQNTSRRSRAPAAGQSSMASEKPHNEDNLNTSARKHGNVLDNLHEGSDENPNSSSLPRPRVSTSKAAGRVHTAPNQRLGHTPVTADTPAHASLSGGQYATKPSAALALPRTPPDRRGNGTPSSARLPIFDSDSEDGLPSPQSVKASGAYAPDPLLHTDGHSSGPCGQQSPVASRSRSRSPENHRTSSLGNIGSSFVATGTNRPAEGSTTASKPQTPVHKRRGRAEDAHRHGPGAKSDDLAVSFGLTDEMLLPPSDDDDNLHPSPGPKRAGVTAELPSVPIAVRPDTPVRGGQGLEAAKALASPKAMPSPAPPAPRAHMGAQEVAVTSQGRNQASAVQRNQPASTRALRSITTPAKQLRLKDEQITDLIAKVETLEKQVNEHQKEVAVEVVAAVEATRSATDAEHERLKAALARANEDVERAKDSTARREATLQKQLRELQLAASSAADDAAAEVARVRDQAARDIRDADSRARLRIDAELAKQKVQLEAEAAALKEERALLDRNRQSAEMLSSLSARVEVASSAAIQREERLASRLEADLQERERRCQQREVAVSQREAAVASTEQDGDVLRKQLLELSAKAQAAASQDAVAAAEDRRRLQHEAARLDAAVNALEQQRQEIAAGIEMERSSLQATRAARDTERARFLQEVTEERRRLAEERTVAWAEMDRLHSETAQAQSKVVELEAQSAAALLETSKSRDAKAALDMEMQQAKAQLRMTEQQLAADQAAVESERQQLLHDTQMLHDGTQQLRQLRGAVAQEKESVLDTMRKLDHARADIQSEKSAAAAQLSAASVAEKQIGELRIKLSEKRAQLSNEMVKHGRVQAAWHNLREQIQQQLCAWSTEHPNLPSFSGLWEILVCTEDGQTIKAVSVPGAKHTHQQDARPADMRVAAPVHVHEELPPAAGKENFQKAQLSFLSQKISVLDSIITKRRSLPQQQDINTKFMAELGKRHRELGISETLAWGRQMQMPGFPVHGSGSAGPQTTLIQHPSPMQTPYQTQHVRTTPVNAHPGQAPATGGNVLPISSAGWKLAAIAANAEPSQHPTAGPSQRAASLPSGFVPLQPVSTTEDSFSYRGSLERSRASKRQSPSTSHNVESATSQDHMSQDHQESPGTESCHIQIGDRAGQGHA